MGDVLVYVERANVRADAKPLLAWARPLTDAAGGDLVAVVVGSETSSVAGLDAADVVVEISHPVLSPYIPEAHQIALVAAIEMRNTDVVLIENTTAGLDLAAAVAAKTNLPFVASCLELSISSPKAQSVSVLYGGQLLATVDTPLPAVFAVNSAALSDQPAPPGRGERLRVAPPNELDRLKTAFVEAVTPPSEGIDITKAERLVCVGRGIGDAENISAAAKLADALGAELAGSRPVIDAGWLPRARQVGKSGVRVKPKLYVALGVSGAPEHLEGIQGAELIVAVNQDPEAPIFGVAHYGAVADLFEVAAELVRLMGS